MKFRLLLMVFILNWQVLSWGATSRCQTKQECSYNGKCVRRNCECYPQFTGDYCGKFNFAPLNASKNGEGLRSIDAHHLQISSWGGSVILADDGLYHMWAAEMIDGTGIKSWITNSQVVHAVAQTPSKPFAFTRHEVVWPVFAHEPTVSRAPTGEFVMFFTTNYGQKKIPCTGHSCFGYNGTSDRSCPNDQQCDLDPPEPLLTRMSWSKSPDGPWSTPVLVPSPGPEDTNLACVINQNSSLICLGRPDLGVLFASDWRQISTYSDFAAPDTSGIRPDQQFRGEDPMLWVDQDGVYHAVLHGGGWESPFGYHYWTHDGLHWYGHNDIKVYDHIVLNEDGEMALNLSRRERPHVVLGQDGQTPIALTAGVTEGWPCTLDNRRPKECNYTSICCPVDYCYTFAQPLVGWERNH